jgi:hypothetical protein
VLVVLPLCCRGTIIDFILAMLIFCENFCELLLWITFITSLATKGNKQKKVSFSEKSKLFVMASVEFKIKLMVGSKLL